MAFGCGFSIPAFYGAASGLGMFASASLYLDFTSGNQTLDLRITFTRGSNATRTNSAGLIAYAPHNLLMYSEQFDNAIWTKTGATIAANTIVAPDGTLTADKIVENSGALVFAGVTRSNTVTAATSYTQSVYLKAGERTWASLRVFDSSASPTTRFAFFNLSTGTIGTTSAGVTASISSVGNGWYRCAIVYTSVATSNTFQLTIAEGDNDTIYTGDGTSGLYLWGAQLNVGALQPYYPTTSAAYYGPRFDYDPVTLQPKGLLIEEQRTNLLTYGSLIDTTTYSGSWGKGTNTTRVSTNIVAPDGTATAVSYSGNGSASFEFVSQPVSLAANTTYTLSVYAKLVSGSVPTSGTILSSQYNNGTTTTRTTVNFSGKLTSQWQRFTTTFTNVNAGTFTQLFLTDQTNTAEIAIWGAQLEAGSFPTSYIPTTSAQVTRAADVATMTGTNFSSWYNQSEGTFVWSGDVNDVATTPAVISASDGSDATNLLQINTSGSGVIRMGAVASSATQVASVSSGVTASPRVQFNAAFGVQPSNYAISVNGSTPVTQLSGMVPTVNQLRFLQTGSGGSVYSGHIKRLAYWPRRLSNTELQGISA